MNNTTNKNNILDDLDKDLEELEKEIIIKKTTKKRSNINVIEEKQDKSKKLVIIKELKIKKFNFQKPFLKWVGGKTQIIDTIINEMPIEIDNYHEIFLGGGSVLFAVLCLKKENHIKIKNKIYAYDINKPLIYLYKNIQNESKEFIKTITKIINEYNNIDTDTINRKPKNLNEAKTSQESYYYWIRQQYNLLNQDEQCSILGSAYFLFLNKTCFRGVFRTSKNGFNVPFGHYNNPGIADAESIAEISKLIKDVLFIHKTFEDSVLEIKKDDYAYFDPPYLPVSATSFVGYTADGFDLKLHDKLFKMCHKLKDNKIKFMMSNSNAKLVVDEFKKNNYDIQFIECRRAINSKKPDSKIDEILVKSY
jgi:DNA adenine methylase